MAQVTGQAARLGSVLPLQELKAQLPAPEEGKAARQTDTAADDGLQEDSAEDVSAPSTAKKV